MGSSYQTGIEMDMEMSSLRGLLRQLEEFLMLDMLEIMSVNNLCS